MDARHTIMGSILCETRHSVEHCTPHADGLNELAGHSSNEV